MTNIFGKLLRSKLRYSFAVLLNTAQSISRLRLAFHPNMLVITLLGFGFGFVFFSLPAQVFAKEQSVPTLERKIQILKEMKKGEAPATQTLKLKKGILYDLFDLVIEEDEKLSTQLIESHLSTSTQEIFLTALWDDEQWYLEKRLETSKATSTDAIARITKSIKKHRQEIQDILQKQISGMMLIGDAEYTLSIAKNRLNEIKTEIGDIQPEEKKNTLLNDYLAKVQSQLEEADAMVQETRDIFENLENKKEYEAGIKNIGNASELIKLIYEEFLAMGRLTGNPLFPQETKDKPLGLEDSLSPQSQI